MSATRKSLLAGDEPSASENIDLESLPEVFALTYTEAVRTCYKPGISLKVAKTKDTTLPMQFEYAVWDDHYSINPIAIARYTFAMTPRRDQTNFDNCTGYEITTPNRRCLKTNTNPDLSIRALSPALPGRPLDFPDEHSTQISKLCKFNHTSRSATSHQLCQVVPCHLKASIPLRKLFSQAFPPGQIEAKTSRSHSTGHYQTELLASVLPAPPFRATCQQASREVSGIGHVSKKAPLMGGYYGAPQPMNQFTDPNDTTVFIGGLSGYVTVNGFRSFLGYSVEWI
ncbi:hypothetical protein J4E91_004650 [Alternaria rosae]|nr:hypothetical protein J4E91_004650 [Alternaria rosae]